MSDSGLNLRFFGAVAASLSHEINNVLAIINELSGLMEDLMAAAESGRPLDPGKLKNSTERIAKQVDRGKGYVKLLNRFSHTVDADRTQFDAGEAFEEILLVCQRFCTLKKVGMQVHLPASPLSLEGSPFDFEHLVYRCVDAVLSVMPPDSGFEIRLEPDGEGARIEISGAQTLESDGEAHVSRIAGLLGGSLLGDTGSEPPKLVVTLPGKLDSLAFSGAVG